MKIALIASPTNINRFTPGFKTFAQDSCEFWQIDIYRTHREILDLIKQWRPDGIITEYIGGITDKLIKKIEVPVVVAPNDATDFKVSGCLYVDVDDRKVGYQVGRYFYDQGYRNIAFYGNNMNYSRQRMEGFTEFLNGKKIKPYQFIEQIEVFRRYTEYWQDFKSTASQWLRELPKPCALFAAHDPLGRSLLSRCKQEGIKVPEQISVISANNDPLICDLVNPPLSSVNIPWNKVGYEATRILIEKITGRFQGQETTLLDPLAIEHRQSSNILHVENPVLSKALHFIRNQLLNGVRVIDVANHCHTNRRTLEKLFQKYLDKTPGDEILRLKVERAKDLLIETDLQMPDVAERSGFSHPERFSVNFKKYTEMTPTQYRKKYRWGYGK